MSTKTWPNRCWRSWLRRDGEYSPLQDLQPLISCQISATNDTKSQWFGKHRPSRTTSSLSHTHGSNQWNFTRKHSIQKRMQCSPKKKKVLNRTTFSKQVWSNRTKLKQEGLWLVVTITPAYNRKTIVSFLSPKPTDAQWRNISQSQKSATFFVRDFHGPLDRHVWSLNVRRSLNVPHLHNPADPGAAQSRFTGSLWSLTHARTGLGSDPNLNRSHCLPPSFPEFLKGGGNTRTVQLGGKITHNAKSTANQTGRLGVRLLFRDYFWPNFCQDGRWITENGGGVEGSWRLWRNPGRWDKDAALEHQTHRGAWRIRLFKIMPAVWDSQRRNLSLCQFEGTLNSLCLNLSWRRKKTSWGGTDPPDDKPSQM